MRQAGVLAAAGIVALETMVDRLVDDHARASALAEALESRFPGSVDPGTVETNIVWFDVRGPMNAPEVAAALGQRGVLIGGYGQQRMRAVAPAVRVKPTTRGGRVRRGASVRDARLR